MLINVLVLLLAYLLGSFPSALIVARRVADVDIRTVGDANMGARNVARTLGTKPGILVALLDVSKGIVAVLLAKLTDMGLPWQIAAAFCAVLGHDFPLFARLRGGQGLATTLGVLTILAPREALIGGSLYGLLYLVTHNSDFSAGTGVGLMVLLMWVFEEPSELLVSSVVLILTIPAKMLLDKPRRQHLQHV